MHDALSTHGSPGRVLVVDDDPGIRTLIADFLSRNGYETSLAGDTREMRARLASEQIDLVVLDLMLPGEDGLSALRRLQGQSNGPPVIMLSAVGSDIDRVIGLEVGADDYLAKPCNPRELLARIRTVLRPPRRAPRGQPAPSAEPGALRFAGWRMDLIERAVTDPDGRSIRLSDGEFALLRAFALHPRRVMTRDQLLDAARGQDCDFYDRAIDVQVSRLRRKLGASDMIRTVRSEGYLFVPEVA